MLEERPWGDWNKGRGITARQVARMLAPFGVRPEPIRLTDGRQVRGYHRERFTEAFARYVPDRGQVQATPQLEVGVTYYTADYLLRPRRQVGPLSIIGL